MTPRGETGSDFGVRPTAEGSAAEPMRIPCEGGGWPGNQLASFAHGCKMCGRWFVARHDGAIPLHERDDILAMIDRGDFG